MQASVQRLTTTVLAVVGDEADRCVASFADAANVRVVQPPTDDDATTRAASAWAQAAKSHAPFTIHDADPLAPVAEAWATSFAGGPRGDLDVLVADATARWRATSIGLPDYYFVLDPDDLEPGPRDWYLGVLHRAAPHRVVPVAADGDAVRAAIGRLAAGRWWPDLPELLDGIDRLLPDQAMLAQTETTEQLAAQSPRVLGSSCSSSSTLPGTT